MVTDHARVAQVLRTWLVYRLATQLAHGFSAILSVGRHYFSPQQNA